MAELLTPKNIIGCKRLCIDTGYFETFNRPNVTLIDIAETGIEAITAKGVRANGREFEVDAIVYATGFDAMTGALNRIDIRGNGGLRLRTSGRAARAATSASASPVSRTCSRSPGPAARRC